MKLSATEIPGAYVLDPEPLTDERGYFARQWCSRELGEHGLVGTVAQISLSFNRAQHTLRGMHYAVAPAAETKVVHCVHGSIYDVLLDMRDGPTHLRWAAFELTATNHRMLYVPEGVAHGFLTLEPDTEVQYFISAFFDASCARGVRYDDPAFGIAWPAAPAVISTRDANYPSYAT